MDHLLDETPDRRYARDDRHMRLPVDAYTTDDELVFTAAVPGVNPDDVEITFEGDVLSIKGEIPAPLGNVDYVTQERPYGAFQRTINIGIPVEQSKIAASVERGQLVITLPKAQEAKPKTIPVTAK
jgi:HSP20 family protein